jgi:hypothetical protein
MNQVGFTTLGIKLYLVPVVLVGRTPGRPERDNWTSPHDATYPTWVGREEKLQVVIWAKKLIRIPNTEQEKKKKIFTG